VLREATLLEDEGRGKKDIARMGKRYGRQRAGRTKNDAATLAEYWRRVPRGAWGTGRNACATGRRGQRQKQKSRPREIRAGRKLRARCNSTVGNRGVEPRTMSGRQPSIGGRGAWGLGRRLKPTLLEGGGKGKRAGETPAVRTATAKAKTQRAGETAEADDGCRTNCGGGGINAGL
jgi:hypothetical protein